MHIQDLAKQICHKARYRDPRNKQIELKQWLETLELAVKENHRQEIRNRECWQHD